MALLTRQPSAGLLHHSDRGAQSTRCEYQAIFARFGSEVSLSRAHNCFDNAPIESVWGKLITECVYRYHFKTRAQPRTVILVNWKASITVSVSIRRSLISYLNSSSKPLGQTDLSSLSRPSQYLAVT